jgi:hypothetical protein
MSLDLLILNPWNSWCTLDNWGVHFILCLYHTYSYFFLFSSFSHTHIFVIFSFLSLFLSHQNSNGSQKFWNKEQDEKELNQVHKFKSPCILLMNSHLIFSQAYLFYSFPSHIYEVGFIWSSLGKFKVKLSVTCVIWTNSSHEFFLPQIHLLPQPRWAFRRV